MMKYNAIFALVLSAALLLSGCQSGGASSQSAPQSGAQSPAVSQSGDMSQPADVSQGADVSQPEPAVWEDIAVNKTDEELIAMSQSADWSWFDDAVMIGDSVSLKLKNYVTKMRQTAPDYFGGGQFLASGSLGSGNALWEVSDKSVHPTYQGEKLLLEESILRTGAKKVYMMLGTNDIAVYGLEGAVANYEALLDRIQAANPDAAFYIQSATPICNGAEVGALNTLNLEQYNVLLKEMCQRRNIAYVDVARVMVDNGGFLPREYCSDPDGMGIHLTDIACELWLGCLLEDAALRTGSAG